MSDPLLDWVRANGAPLADPLDGPGQDLGALATLAAVLGAAEVILIGETDHFVHEKSDFRLILCRALLRIGVRTFGEELGWSDGRRVSRYLEAGAAGGLERLSLFGWEGDLRADRNDRPTGLLKASFDAYPVSLMRAEQARFYAGLRAAAEGAAEYFGFDIDALPGGGYADIADRLALAADGTAARACLQRLAHRPGETAVEEARRLTAAKAGATALAGDAASEIAADLDALADSLAYIDQTYSAASYPALRPGMAFREDCMKRRFAAARARAGGGPIALMGHALHLVKDDARLGSGPAGQVGPGGGLTCSLGHHIARELGLRTAAVWLVHGGGEDSQPFPDLPRRLAYPEDSLNARLKPIGRPVIFPVAGAPAGLFDRPLGVGHMYGSVQPVTLAGQVDAIVWTPEASPMQAS